MKILIIAAGLMFAIGVFSLMRLTSTDSQADVKVVDSGSASQKLAADTPLYDVRTVEEFKSGYIETAVNLPLSDIQNGKTPDQNKDAKIYIYCRSGNRSAQAKQILEQAGFSNVIDLGGIQDVIKMGGKKVS
jgi:phage shock protein E